MQKWEYLAVVVGYDSGKVKYVQTNAKDVIGRASRDALFDYLNNLGQEGWELVSVYGSASGYSEYYHFKRPIK